VNRPRILQPGANSLFDWATTSPEARIALSEKLQFRGGLEVSAAGAKYLNFEVRYRW